MFLCQLLFTLWGHPHVIPSPSPIQSRFTSQLSFLCLHTNPHTDPDNSNLTTTAIHSLTPSFSVYLREPKNGPPGPSQVGLHSMSHAYQLCQPANGRAGWTTGDRNKKSSFCPTRFIHLEE